MVILAIYFTKLVINLLFYGLFVIVLICIMCILTVMTIIIIFIQQLGMTIIII